MNKLPRMALSLYVAVFVAAYASPVAMAGAQAGNDAASFAGLAQVKQSLQLNAAQEAKWRAAEAATRRARSAMLGDAQRMMALADGSQLPGPLNIDLQVEAIQVEGRVARDLACASWLAAYESLGEAQKRLATVHIKQALARIDHYAQV